MRTTGTPRGPGADRPAELLRSYTGRDRVIRQAGARADREDPAEIHAETFGPHLGRSRPAARRTRRAAPGRPAFIVYAAS
ncbi:hypothetical protein ACWDYJ_35000 [Streptomyces sp. NPDC003042]